MYEIFLKLMKKKGVTPYRVHKDTGIAQSTLSDWKNGKSTPSTDKMSLLADYFDVSVDYLLGKTTVESPLINTVAHEWGVPPEQLQSVAGGEFGALSKSNQEMAKDLAQRMVDAGFSKGVKAKSVSEDGRLTVTFNPAEMTDTDLEIVIAIYKKTSGPGKDEFIADLQSELDRRREG